MAVATGCVALGAVSLFGQLLVKAPPPRRPHAPVALARQTGMQFAEAYDAATLLTDAAPCVDSDACLKPAAPPPRPVEAKPVALNIPKLATALVQIESAGDPDRVGLHGERGLMQIKAATWESVTRRLYGHPLDFNRAFEKELNLKVGTAYLEELRGFLTTRRDEWQADERLLLLACYNCGPTRVAASGFALAALPFQTQDYVARATALADDS